MSEHERELISLVLAAKRASCSPRTIRRYIAEGRLTGYRLGPRLVRVDASEVDQLAEPMPTAGLSKVRDGA